MGPPFLLPWVGTATSDCLDPSTTPFGNGSAFGTTPTTRIQSRSSWFSCARSQFHPPHESSHSCAWHSWQYRLQGQRKFRQDVDGVGAAFRPSTPVRASCAEARGRTRQNSPWNSPRNFRRSVRVPILVLGSSANMRFRGNVSLGRMRTGVEVGYFLLQLKSACRGRKLGGACVKISPWDFPQNSPAQNESSHSRARQYATAASSYVGLGGLGGISLLANGVVETGRRREPRRDHPGLARMGWRRVPSSPVVGNSGEAELGPGGHQLSGWSWTFRHTVTVAQFPVFRPAARRC